MKPSKAHKDYRAAKQRLLASIAQAYGQELNRFLPEILRFLSSGQKFVNPTHLLNLIAGTAMRDGVPAILGTPYQLHATRMLLAYLIIVENWLPDSMPLLPPATPPGASDVDDNVLRVRDAAALCAAPERLSNTGEAQNVPVPTL